MKVRLFEQSVEQVSDIVYKKVKINYLNSNANNIIQKISGVYLGSDVRPCFITYENTTLREFRLNNLILLCDEGERKFDLSLIPDGCIEILED